MRGFTSNNEGFSIIRIRWHLLFWGAYILINTVTPVALGEKDTIVEILRWVLIQLPLKIFATYSLVYWFIPKYLLKKKYYKFLMIVIPLAFLIGIGQRLLIGLILYPLFYPEYLAEYGLIYWPKVFYAGVETYTVAAVAAVIKLLKHWYTTQQINNFLKQEKLTAELKFLKAQIHPHFLFNTLNNLYALTLKKSPKAPEVVLKLSDLLDYMLYECNVSKVPLEKEIKMLENYIELEKIRYGDDLKIDFPVDSASKNIQISPMLLLPLVENAFKHGVSAEINAKWVRINLETNNGIIEFSIENSKDPKSTNNKESYTEGIGLRNVIRRLELVYKDMHQLQVTDKGSSFKVVLKINTSEQ